MRLNDAILGLGLILLAGWMIWLTTFFPAFPGQDYGPDLFPRILGAGIILCGAVLVARGIAARRGGGPWIAFADWVREPGRLASFLAMIGAMLLYLFASEPVGFIPVAFAILVGLFLWFGVDWRLGLPVAAGMTLLVHWFFASLMRVPLPRGVLTDVL
jgi:putative tricarboxylic transport membrane protein